MPRKPNLEISTRLMLRLPESTRAKLDLFLFSELEGRVPQGRYQEFFMERLKEFFEQQQLDLSPFGISGAISGSPKTLDELKRKLSGDSL